MLSSNSTQLPLDPTAVDIVRDHNNLQLGLILASLEMTPPAIWPKMKSAKRMRAFQAVTAGQVCPGSPQIIKINQNKINHLTVNFSGFARRKHREPCRKVVSLLMSMRVDRFYERRIVWDKLLSDTSSEPYGHLAYEALRAVSSYHHHT